MPCILLISKSFIVSPPFSNRVGHKKLQPGCRTGKLKVLRCDFAQTSSLKADRPQRAKKGKQKPVDQQTRKALKHDQFVDTTTHGLEWASENRRSVIVTSSIVLAAILFVVCAVLIYNSRASQASVAFGAAMQAYQTPLAAPGQPVLPASRPTRRSPSAPKPPIISLRALPTSTA